MQLKFGDYNEGYGAELFCPKCGSNYLHHDKVEIFDRVQDATEGFHVTVANGTSEIDRLLTGNPSRQRHGLNIYFWCEGCSAKPVLSVAQHKGVTLFDLSYAEEDVT